MARHTTAPWIVVERPSGSGLSRTIVSEYNGQALARLVALPEGAEVSRANANAMAAAPDMIAVLREVYEWFGGDARAALAGGEDESPPEAMAVRLRDVIAKAEGR